MTFARRVPSLLFLLVAILAMSASGQGVKAQPAGDEKEYRLIDLGDLGGRSTSPGGMNAYHQVVGSSSTGELDEFGNDISHAFLWTPVSPGGSVGSMIDLGTLGGTHSQATAINSRGQVVGLAQNEDGKYQAFLWTPTSPNGTSGNMVAIQRLNGQDPESALDINDYGQIVGQLDADSGYLFTPAEPNGPVGNVTFFNNVTMRGINNFGRFTGQLPNTMRQQQAFVFNPVAEHGNQGTFDLVPFATGATESVGLDINTFGHVSGWDRLNSRSEGFLQRESQHHSIGTLGGTFSSLTALTNVNPPTAVGSSINQRGQFKAIIYRGGQVTDLNTLTEQPDSGPVELTVAADVSADENIVVLWVPASGGASRAGLLTKGIESSIGIKLLTEDDETLVGKSKFSFEVTNSSAERREVKVTLGLDQAPVIAQFGPASAYKGPGRARIGAGGIFEITGIVVKPRKTVTGKHLIQAARTGEYEITGRSQTEDAGKPQAADAVPLKITVGELIPENVTGELEIVRGPQQGTGRTVKQKITFTNRGPAGASTSVARALTGPFYLVTDGLSRGELSKPDGKTAKLEPLGAPYIKVNRPNLKPNKKFTATLKFKRPAGVTEEVLYSLRVLAGKGTP